MSQIEPPPNRIEKFNYIWKEWLNRLWVFIQAHTGGSSTGGTGTGSDWNAHGNTAVGDATNPLVVTPGSFTVTGTPYNSAVGNTPTEIETTGAHMAFIPNKWGSFRVGATSGTQWLNTNIGNGSIAMGFNPTASGLFSVALGAATTASGLYTTCIGNNSSTTGTLGSSITLGSNCVNDADYATAIGYNADIPNTGSQASAIGYNVDVAGAFSIGVGWNVDVDSSFAVGTGVRAVLSSGAALAYGRDVQATNTKSCVIGVGVDDVQPLVNNIANSMAIGVNTTKATLLLTASKCGIEQDAPLSTLDIGGSVGYKYRIVDTGDSPVTLSDELTVIVDNSGGPVVLNLPATAGIDRRIYHIKRTSSGGGSVKVYAASGEYIDGVLADSTTAGFSISLRDAPMLLCDDTSTNNGWWIL